MNLDIKQQIELFFNIKKNLCKLFNTKNNHFLDLGVFGLVD